jgi:SAM-dependent methyltransferase
MSKQNLDSWSIKSIPFVWSPLDTPKNGTGIPDTLPFELGVDLKTGRVLQLANDDVKSALVTAYEKGSALSGLMDDNGIGKNYAEDFLSFIFRSISKTDLSGLNVLEIGCGNGYLLKRLKDAGAEVLGVEPGNHGQQGAKKWHVPVIKGVFPNKSIQSRFDLIIAFAVLEHVENPSNFLASISKYLKPNGKIIIAVPDERPYIDNGDISTLFHEHWSFFDDVTLSNTVKMAGYMEMLSEVSSYGGSLYCAMSITQNPIELQPENVSSAVQRARNYIVRSQDNNIKFEAYCKSIAKKNETLAIYVPGRAVNALAISGTSLTNIRFIDDNPLLLGKYFPGINIPIEDRASLSANPTNNILVMSRTFGAKLVGDLKQAMPTNTNVHSISEILK